MIRKKKEEKRIDGCHTEMSKGNGARQRMVMQGKQGKKGF